MRNSLSGIEIGRLIGTAPVQVTALLRGLRPTKNLQLAGALKVVEIDVETKPL